MQTEWTRYKEYLQGKLLTEDWQAFVNRAERGDRESFSDYLAKLRKAGVDTSAFDDDEKLHGNAFAPDTKYSQDDVVRIFQPLLDRLEKAALEVGLKSGRPVELATATDSSPGPVTIPSNERHLIFVGAGTGKFSNDWAVAFTDTSEFLLDGGFERVPNPLKLGDISRKTPRVASVAFCLARHFAKGGTAITAPSVEPDYSKRHCAHRSYVLDAMELFVLGHEYGHCLAHERMGTEATNLTPEESYELEFYCDQIGLKLSRPAAAVPPNVIAYSGAGAVLFLHAVHLCECARVVAGGSAASLVSATHPPVPDRIAKLRQYVVNTTPADDREMALSMFDYFHDLSFSVSCFVLAVLAGSQGRSPGQPPE